MEIKIDSLRLENFKRHKHLTLNFGGGNASIYGENATGKTSIYDALVWLLFGKSSCGKTGKDFSVKPLGSDGEVKDHDALTEVEAVLQVDGQKITLRRTYKEVWSTKRGSAQATYDGNTSEYFIDGVPLKKNAFQDAVSDLVDEDTFRLLTSVNHFAAGISWQDRRAVLFKVAGVMDDRQILATDERFRPLIEGMGRLDLDGYKKKLLAEKKGFSKGKTEIPARVSECEKTIADIADLDFAAARAELAAKTAQADALSGQMVTIRNNNAIQQKNQEIQGIQLELANLEVENRSFRANQNTGGVNVSALQAGIGTMERQRAVKAGQLANEEALIAKLEEKVSAARTEWVAVNSEAYTGGICPACGQALPADKLEQAVAAFNSGKQKRLDGILALANANKDAKAAAEARCDNLKEEIAKLDSDIQEQRRAVAEAQANVVPIVDMSDYAQRKAALEAKIQMLSGELMDLQSDSAAALDALQLQKDAIDREIAGINATLGKESLLDYSKQRVEQLREEARNASAALEVVETMLMLLDEYSRYKTRFVEDSINGLFRVARFRLFREQANGGLEERCDVVYDGVPYPDVNDGMKVNLGIDIINALSAAFNVRVPLFVDNAESVTRLEASASQIIRLVVSENDKELRVNYEN